MCRYIYIYIYMYMLPPKDLPFFLVLRRFWLRFRRYVSWVYDRWYTSCDTSKFCWACSRTGAYALRDRIWGKFNYGGAGKLWGVEVLKLWQFAKQNFVPHLQMIRPGCCASTQSCPMHTQRYRGSSTHTGPTESGHALPTLVDSSAGVP